MSPGAKIFLTLAAAGGVLGVLAIAASKPAHAAPKQPPQPAPGSNAPPDVIVPEPGQSPGVPAGAPPPAQGGQPPSSAPPLPQPPAPVVQLPPTALPATLPGGVPAGVTFSLPNPLGGPPLGTFDPATGNVFGPNGVVIGQFNPKTGVLSTSAGQQIQIPGFGGSAPPPAAVPTPTPATPATAPTPLPPAVVVQLPTGPVPIPLPPIAPAAPPAPASGTTVQADTAAMVSQLLDAETRAGWNKKDAIVGVWQSARPPLVVDQKYGPNSALALAREIGTLPLIRFWPTGSTKAKALADYQAKIIALANASQDPVHANQLRVSAQREQAQAFSTTGPLKAVPVDQQVQIGKVA